MPRFRIEKKFSAALVEASPRTYSFCSVVYGSMAGEFFSGLPVHAAFIGAQVRGFVDASFQDRAQVRGIHFRHVLGADAAVALNQRHDSLFGSGLPIGAVASPTADESFVSFDEHAFAAERAKAAFAHRLADAMPDEPAGLEIDAEDAAELVCAESFLAASKQVHRLQPDVHRDMAGLEDSADFDGKWLATGVALVDADPGAFAFQLAAFVNDAAMRADAPFGHTTLRRTRRRLLRCGSGDSSRTDLGIGYLLDRRIYNA